MSNIEHIRLFKWSQKELIQSYQTNWSVSEYINPQKLTNETSGEQEHMHVDCEQ